MHIPQIPQSLKQWVICTATILLALMAQPSRTQADSNWVGTTTDWNTNSNWSPASVPNSANAVVDFNSASQSTVNISSNVSAKSLNFNSASFTITSSANQALLNVTSINVASTLVSPNSAQINLAAISTGSLLFASPGNLTITNNSPASNALTIGATTVVGTAGAGGVIFLGAGFTSFNGSFASTTSNNFVDGGLNQSGPGILDYSGDGSFLQGSLTVSGGILGLDYRTNTATKIQSTASAVGSALKLNGGFLQLITNNANITQSFINNTSVNAGHTDVSGLTIGIGSITLVTGVITHSLAGTVDFTPQSGVLAIQTSTGNSAGGLLGNGPAFATVNGGANWAVQSGVVVAPLAGFSTNIYTSNANTDVTASTLLSTSTTNSLRFNTPGNLVITINNTLTLQSGGILVTPSATGGAQTTGGTLTAAGGGELLFHVYGANLEIFSAIATTTGLTKTGPGLLLLEAASPGLTSPININRGDLEVLLNTSAVNSASQINFNDNRNNTSQTFTIDLNLSNNGTITPPIRLSDVSNTFNTGTSTHSTITLSGVLSSTANLNTPITFTGPDNTMGFNLTNPGNTFTGNITLLHGSLGIVSDGSLGNSANSLSLAENDLFAGGLVFLNSGVNVAHAVILPNGTSRIVSNGTDSNTISTPISGPGGFVKDGTGKLTIGPGNTFSGGVLVLSGTLSLGNTGALVSGINVTVTTGATFDAGTTIGGHLGTLFLSGGTFHSNASAGFVFVNQIDVDTTGGTIDLTGANAGIIALDGAGAAITIAGNATWLSPSNSANIANTTNSPVPILISRGVTLNNGIALDSVTGFVISGGGTLFQNSDNTNVLNMSAPITVASATTFRVSDASSNSGVGNLGTGTFTLDGGTFEYSGPTASTSKPITITSNNGTVQVDFGSTLTASGILSGPGALTKTGSGTLILTNSGNSFSNLTINTGTIQTASDGALGPASAITINPAGNLTYTASTITSRTFNLNSGTLQANSGVTVMLSGDVNGGFLRGPGNFALAVGVSLNGVTTFTSTIITPGSGQSSATNFTNGGTLNVNANFNINGGTNTASGVINLEFPLTVTDFTNDGLINIPAGTGMTANNNLYLGGGARMFIGSKTNIGGVLVLNNGATLEVNGALLVNDGTITGTTDVNYGGQANGIGTFSTVNVSFGGLYQPGFASSALPGNGATVGALSGNGTIDNATAGGNMLLTVNGNSASTFSGPIQNTQGTLSVSVQGTSSLTLLTSPLPGGGNSINTYSGGTTIAAGGTVIIGAAGALPSGGPVNNNGTFTVNANSTSGAITGSGLLSIGAPLTPATLTLAAGSGTSTIGTLSLDSASTLNFSTGTSMIIHNSSNNLSLLTADISHAYNINSALWSGTGITSSTAPAGQGLGILTGAQYLTLHNTPFNSLTVLATDILIKYTYMGDANLDGNITIDDYLQLDAAFLQPTANPTWFNGDFNYDGTVNFKDYALIDFALQNQSGTLADAGLSPAAEIALHTAEFGAPYTGALAALNNSPAPIPEPASLAILFALVPSFLLRPLQRKGKCP